VVVVGWGYFLIAGIRDDYGGIRALWPLFGIANQLLAAVALAVGTVIIVREGKGRWAWITIMPLCWLLFVTETAGWQKIADPSPKVGFMAAARAKDDEAHHLAAEIVRLRTAGGEEPAETARVAIAAAERKRQTVLQVAFNNRVDAMLCALFMLVILVVAGDAARACWKHRRTMGLH
jgi:carbon starvation protein